MAVESILTSRLFRAFFLLLITSATQGATLDYCASGCTYADPNAAITVASDGDTILQVGAAPYTMATSPFLIIKAITWTSDQPMGTFVDLVGNRAVCMTSGVTAATTILNMQIEQDHATTGPRCMDWTSLGVGASLFLKNCNFVSLANSPMVTIPVILITANQFYAKDCKFFNPSKTGVANQQCLSFAAADIVVGVARFDNCLFCRGYASGGGAQGTGVTISTSVLSTGDLVNFYNCTFSGFATGINSSARMGATNCLFLYNTTDLGLSGAATVTTDWIRNGFAQATDNGNYGANNLFGLTSTSEYANKISNCLLSGALSRNAGVSVSGITNVSTGMNGVKNYWNGQIDLGCNPYSPALVPYRQNNQGGNSLGLR